ncbi:12451_t:CDS:1, partial [Cetraspora pellucida]
GGRDMHFLSSNNVLNNLSQHLQHLLKNWFIFNDVEDNIDE